jgi:hypothetical protein
VQSPKIDDDDMIKANGQKQREHDYFFNVKRTGLRASGGAE